LIRIAEIARRECRLGGYNNSQRFLTFASYDIMKYGKNADVL